MGNVYLKWFDQPVKIFLLCVHAIGFSVWIGIVFFNVSGYSIFMAIAVASGILLTGREIYKDGWGWLLLVEGVLTMVKVIILGLSFLYATAAIPLVCLVLVCGVLSSHLPKDIRERRLIWTGHESFKE